MFKGTKFNLEITDIDQMRDRVVSMNSTPQRLQSLSQDSGDEKEDRRHELSPKSVKKALTREGSPDQSPGHSSIKDSLSPIPKQM